MLQTIPCMKSSNIYMVFHCKSTSSIYKHTIMCEFNVSAGCFELKTAKLEKELLKKDNSSKSTYISQHTMCEFIDSAGCFNDLKKKCSRRTCNFRSSRVFTTISVVFGHWLIDASSSDVLTYL